MLWLLLLLLQQLAAAAHAPAANSSSNICGQNATIGRAVVAAVNLSFPGLDAVSAAAAAGDLNAACDALAAYYAAANTSAWLRRPPVAPGTGRVGGGTDQMVDSDYFFLDGVQLGAVIPRNADGGLDWLDHGPRDDPEFMNCLNRHDSFVDLLEAYAATGNPVYTRYFDALVIDWVLHLACPDALAAGADVVRCQPLGVASSSPAAALQNCSWDDTGGLRQQRCLTGTMESPWRSLEMGIRMVSAWPKAFFGFQNAPAADFTVSARVLMALAVREHHAALLVDGGHPGSGVANWEIVQWQGLAASASAFPELRNASDFLDAALGYLADQMDESVCVRACVRACGVSE